MATTNDEKLGFLPLTALVAGNMIGSGIFLLPANLAKIGSISLFSWGITAVGAFLLSLVFSKMSTLFPKTGGPFIYAERGFGSFIGFQTAYSYWIAIWIGNAATVIAMVAYLTVFLPFLKLPFFSCLVAIGTIWFLTFMNIKGLKTTEFIQMFTTTLKFIPILLIIFLGWFYFHPEYLSQYFNVSGKSGFKAISNGMALTLWAFIGLESATIPAASVKNPSRNIPLATLIGTLVAAVVYILSSTVIMGMIRPDILAQTSSPFAAAAEIIFGNWGKWLIAAGAVISCFGCLNGWIFLQGQLPMAAADEGLFPAIFAKRNPKNIPIASLVMTSILITGMLLLTATPELNKQFELMALMATLAFIMPYFYTAFAQMILLKEQPNFSFFDGVNFFIAFFAGIYVFWMIFSSGRDILFYSMILLFTSVPVYVWMRHTELTPCRTERAESEHEFASDKKGTDSEQIIELLEDYYI